MNLRRKIIKQIQKAFWVYFSDIFFVFPGEELNVIHPRSNCTFVPINSENCYRVLDFREEDLTAEFRDKLLRGERGFFAVCEGKMAGSIWATINETDAPAVARGYMRLMPREALIHDIVTGAKYRGMGVGPFMVTRISPILFQQHSVGRIIIDVNVRNAPSLRMMNKAGLQARQKTLAVSLFQKLVFHKILAKDT